MPETTDSCRFTVDLEKCIGCGACARDCVAGIIVVRGGKPHVPPESAGDGIGCQHCLAVCPVGAASVLGLSPEDSIPLNKPGGPGRPGGPEEAGRPAFAPDALALLVKARRSVRQFSPEPVPRDLLDRLLAEAAYAPTGVNSLSRRVAVIRDPAVMDAFRCRAAETLAVKKAEIPEQLSWLVDMAEGWLSGGPDELFRSAPHLLVLSAPKDAPCPTQDCLIEMAYFDLLAQANGVGTVWAGIVHWLLQALPELQRVLGIPDGHLCVYAMMFGLPKTRYARTVQRAAENIAFIDAL